MQWSDKKFYLLLVTIVAISGIVFAYRYFSASGGGETLSAVTVPELSAAAAAGETAFDKNCVQCHGANAAGSEQGPPLVHDIYNPGHHGDGAFVRAAQQGVRQHHWPFGDMPAQPQVSEEEVAAIVRYVRELQVANGIVYREHNM